MTEQERNVLLNELRQQESQREKQIKRERFRRLNPYAKKGAVVFAGSSLMEQFPLYEFLQDDDLHCTLYNRGIGGFTTTELLEAMDECILELQPAHLFLNIGTNDLNGPDYDRAAMLGRYEEIVQQPEKTARNKALPAGLLSGKPHRGRRPGPDRMLPLAHQ